MEDGVDCKEKFPDVNDDVNIYVTTLEELSARITIERPVFKQRLAGTFPTDTTALCNNNNSSCHFRPKSFLKKTIPSITWIYNYKWKEWLVKDVIAGFTVAVLNIPQGMAYALLGNVPPIIGLYMAFFPVIIYAFLGTSRHVSMGTFAVICLMVGNVVTAHSDTSKFLDHNTTNINNVTFQYTPIQVATAVTFLVGVYQVIMYIFRLGIICTLLSETLISGFTAGAAIHVLTSQIRDMLGLKLHQSNGSFKLIYVYIEIFSKLHTANIAAATISAITIIVLVTNNEIIKPFVEKRTIIPVPIELLVVLVGTLVSNYSNITETYNLKTVGHIAIGLPSPVVPDFDIMPSIAVDSAIIAVIAYIITLSMALIFANKCKYEIDANQELLAQGLGNVLGSFFSCLPFSASLSRSVLQHAAGGVTQMASLVSCALLLVVLLWIGPFFEQLPRCILASLIVVALKSILAQARDIFQIWSVSRADGLIWLVTYLTVICVKIEYGLLAGVIVSILIVIISGAKGDISVLGRVRNSELYLDVKSEPKVELIPGITIIRYCGTLNFINKNYFEKQLLKCINVQPVHADILNKVIPNKGTAKETIILDFRSLHSIDTSGGKILKKIMNITSENNMIYLVGLSDMVLKILNALEVFNDTSIYLMPTVHDAVVSAQSRSKENIYNVRL